MQVSFTGSPQLMTSIGTGTSIAKHVSGRISFWSHNQLFSKVLNPTSATSCEWDL